MAGAQDDMDKFFDFRNLTLPEETTPQFQLDDGDFMADLSAVPDLQPSICTTHPGEQCLCAGTLADFGFDTSETTANLQPADYANFAMWIPRFSLPAKACGYCELKGLDCFFTYEGQQTCSPCNALFRCCSFSHDGARPDVVMDTLHPVEEDQLMAYGAFTGSVALKSFDRSAFEVEDNEEERTSRKTGIRFPRAATKILKQWMEEHRQNPYPSEEEKTHLQALTGLNSQQVSNWLANTRRRTKTKSRGVSPSIRSPAWPTSSSSSSGASPAINIPFDKRDITHNGKTWDIMNPLERWQHSPPENEPARIGDIAQAVAKTRPASHESSFSSSVGRRNIAFESSAGSSLSQPKAPSCISAETGLSESLISSGSLSNLSLDSSVSRGSLNSRGKDRRRRRRTAANPSRNANIAELRPFQCTFCTDRFRTKYDWSRHEKSLHLSLEKWICAPIGPVVTVDSTGHLQCVYCGDLNPTAEHTESHNHRACEEKGIDARTFYRKDHLRQHLRLVHGCKIIESMDTWKSEATFIRSRCGFCRQEFTKWQDRVDHLSKHFRTGAQMKNWKGCRGLDPAVAAQVTNAMPPYLIGNEATSPFPFSASNEATWSQNLRFVTASPAQDNLLSISDAPIWGNVLATEGADYSQASMAHNVLDTTACAPATCSPGAITCWEILTLQLGQYVKEQGQLGITATDDMLQRQARQILYEDDDSWNQTAADNREWLELFKKAHGLPSTADDSRVDLDEDLGGRLAELSFDAFLQDGSWDLFPGFGNMSMPATSIA